VGFPKFFYQFCISFHIPMTLLLLGIVGRGCAFVFRHYDPEPDFSQHIYHWVFRVTSLLTPFFIGTIGGSLIQGRIVQESTSYGQAFIQPWVAPFSFSVGLFTLSISAYLASSYLTGEVDQGEQKNFYHRARTVSQVAMMLAGALVLWTAKYQTIPLIQDFFSHPLSISAIVLATLTVPVYLATQKKWVLRFLSGFQITLVLFAWLALTAPVMMRYQDGQVFTLINASASAPTIENLAICLVLGTLIIFPLLFYSIWVFQRQKNT